MEHPEDKQEFVAGAESMFRGSAPVWWSFGLVTKFELRAESGRSTITLRLDRDPSRAVDGAAQCRLAWVELRFEGVCDVEVRLRGLGPWQVSGFDIVDVRDRQLEGLRVLVEDFENGAVRWYADRVTVVDGGRVLSEN
jgi:hypothetical protein